MWEITLSFFSIEARNQEDVGRANELEAQLANFAVEKADGDFTGSLSGDGRIELYFSVEQRSRFLRYSQKLLRRMGFGAGSYALVCSEGGDAIRVDLESDVPGGMPSSPFPRRRRSRTAHVYDCYAIPLSNGLYGYAQHIATVPPWGDMIQVFALQSKTILGVNELVRVPPLFPPVGSYVPFLVSKGMWEFIGNRQLDQPVELPRFRSNRAIKPGEYQDWVIVTVDPLIYTSVGTLTEEQRDLEYMYPWSAPELDRRITTGINIFDGWR